MQVRKGNVGLRILRKLGDDEDKLLSRQAGSIRH
jgi:hypothetical protein